MLKQAAQERVAAEIARLAGFRGIVPATMEGLNNVSCYRVNTEGGKSSRETVPRQVPGGLTGRSGGPRLIWFGLVSFNLQAEPPAGRTSHG